MSLLVLAFSLDCVSLSIFEQIELFIEFAPLSEIIDFFIEDLCLRIDEVLCLRLSLSSST